MRLILRLKWSKAQFPIHCSTGQHYYVKWNFFGVPKCLVAAISYWKITMLSWPTPPSLPTTPMPSLTSTAHSSALVCSCGPSPAHTTSCWPGMDWQATTTPPACLLLASCLLLDFCLPPACTFLAYTLLTKGLVIQQRFFFIFHVF